MSFSLLQILGCIVLYLTVLFTVALVAERGWLPRRIARHPAVYVLSLGVWAGAYAIYGVSELAILHGYNFLLYYLGVVLMFVLGTLFLQPLLRISRVYQLSSVADLLTFRFRSDGVGAAITVAMCITVLPLLALQIQAVADSIHVLAGDREYLLSGPARHDGLAFLFCFIITIFALLFGTRSHPQHPRNEGLVVAIAFESLVKLICLLGVMVGAVYGAFGGFEGMNAWLAESKAARDVLETPVRGELARGLLLVFFTGAVAMPHIFHMAFAENTDSRHLRAATWGMPLYLLLLSIPVLPTAWAAMKMEQPFPLDYSVLGVGLSLQNSSLSVAAFVAGLSAASATIIVTTLALANMILKHLVLPRQILSIDRNQSIYRQLAWLRRALITALILGGYLFFRIVSGHQSLTHLALVAFAGTLQFLPGIVATLYWPSANRSGLLCGLAAGLGVWFVMLLLPMVMVSEAAFATQLQQQWFGASEHPWVGPTTASLALNCVVFVLVSLVTRTSEDEQVAAEICSMDDLSRPVRHSLVFGSCDEFIQALSTSLGETTARNEVQRALRELQFDADETRPYALRRLRARIEANLSGLLGPAVAHDIINRSIPLAANTGTEDINLIERNLERAQVHFTGLAADLDNLRRHYRQILNNLPVGVCSLGADGEILLWNRNMELTTGIAAHDVLGSHLDSLATPWGEVIGNFSRDPAETALRREVTDDTGASRWISLHKTPEGLAESGEDRVLLMEDITDAQRMEQDLLHNERLASIGRLAAGVAHEVGNPITGIACLAQNLEYEDDLGEIRHTATDILKQTDRVTRIVESLVNFSHVGSSSGDLNLTPCNVADCVDEATSLLALDSSARPVRFLNDCDRETLVLADSQRLLQVFLNLLGNARDASEDHGDIRISENRMPGAVQIHFDDQGSGIPPAVQSRVFEPFYTTKDPGEGTGLGLALVYSIIEDMGGAISLTSPTLPNQAGGTRFTLQLPETSYEALLDSQSAAAENARLEP